MLNLKRKKSFLYLIAAIWILGFQSGVYLPVFHNIRADFNFFGVKYQLILTGHHHEINPHSPVIEHHDCVRIHVGNCPVCDLVSSNRFYILASYNFHSNVISAYKSSCFCSILPSSILQTPYNNRAPPFSV